MNATTQDSPPKEHAQSGYRSSMVSGFAAQLHHMSHQEQFFGVLLAIYALHLVVVILTGRSFGNIPHPLAPIATLACLPVLFALFVRGSRIVRALLATALGVACFFFGSVLHVAHLFTTGVSVSDFTGVLLALAGVVLIGFAFAVALRGRHWVVWVLSGLVVLYVALNYVVTPTIQAAVAVNAPRTVSPKASELGIPGATDVTFLSRNGIRLVGWYVPGQNGAAVILLHGSHVTRESTLPHLRMLVDAGYAVLAYDGHGHGESDGPMDTRAWADVDDVAGAIDFLRSQPGIDTERIAMLGLSTGAMNALRAAAEGLPLEVVIADGAGATTYEDLSISDRQEAMAPVALSVDWLSVRAIELVSGLKEPSSLVSLASNIQAPVLLIATNAYRELATNQAIRDRIGEHATLWYVPDAAHVEALKAHPQDYTERVRTFLKAALFANPTTADNPALANPTKTLSPYQLPDKGEIEELLAQLVDRERRATGMVIGMISADPHERWVVGYGRLSETDPRAPDGETVFEIGSVTKAFTGILLARAVQDGEVKLDDPISKYLPPGVTVPEYKGIPVTFLDLATHRSALPQIPGNFYPKDYRNPYVDYTLEQMYAALSSYQLTRQPGAQFEYSNYGMALLGNLLAWRANQANYEALLVERIAGPLGMNSTRVELTPGLRARLATPHNSFLYPVKNWDMPIFAGCGGIRSTANDMLTFLAANMGLTGTDLLPAMQLAATLQRPANQPYDGIGLGWLITKTSSGFTVNNHGGQTGGYHVYLGWDPDRKIGVVILVNSDIYIEDVGLHLLDPASPLAYHSPRVIPTPVSVDPKILASYAGKYQIHPFQDIVIRVDEARIFMQQANQPEAELFARSENQFLVREGDIELTFYRNTNGEVDRVVFVINGASIEGKKGQ